MSSQKYAQSVRGSLGVSSGGPLVAVINVARVRMPLNEQEVVQRPILASRRVRQLIAT